MTKNKVLMFLGGGRSNLNALITAKKMGIYTIVLGFEGDYPCYKLADKLIYVDIKDKVEVLRVAKNENVNGILLCCSDRALQTVGYICDKLNLCGLSESSSMLCCDKLMMKETLFKRGINTAKYVKVEKGDDVNDKIKTLQFPLIIKAVDLQGSMGMIIINDSTSLQNGFNKVMKETKKSYCIIEEFIKGVEIGAQAFVYNGNILFVLLHGDIIYSGPLTNVPIGHYVPLTMDNNIIKKISNEVVSAIRAIGLDNCAVNVDIILKDEVPYILELTGRVGANCLPELTSWHLGVDYYKMIVSCAIGEDPTEYYIPKISNNVILSRMLTSNDSGMLNNVVFPNNKNVPYAELFTKRGSEIRAFSNSNDCIGQFLCQGNSLSECIKIANDYLNNIKISFI